MATYDQATILVPLTKGFSAIVDESDRPLVEGWTWHASCLNSRQVYARTTKCGNKKITFIMMHRLLTSPPDNLVVDHINGNTLDNRRANLRICTPAQNSRNRPGVNKTSRFRGVSWNKKVNKWHAAIMFNRRSISLGDFASEEAAATAFDLRAMELFGEFATLNFPEKSHVA